MKTYKELTEELYIIELNSLLEHEIVRMPDGSYRDDEGNVTYAKTSKPKSYYQKSPYKKPVTNEVPHAVFIDGHEWKTFPSESHANNVARKIQEKDPSKKVRISPAI
jgi:hypothetical protein